MRQPFAAAFAALLVEFLSLSGTTPAVSQIAGLPVGPPSNILPGLGSSAGGLLGGIPFQPVNPTNTTVAAARGTAQSQSFPPNATFYGVTVRSVQGSGQGFSVTCDSSEIAVGSFCREIQSLPSENGNALLTSGVATYRSAACLWKNSGVYYASASCLSFRPLTGDSFANQYAPNVPLP